MAEDQFRPRDIILHLRNDQLINVAETRRCCDVLQYPLIFWDGADGYNFNVKIINPANGSEINKNELLRIPINDSEGRGLLYFEMLSVVSPVHYGYKWKN
jgi:hypothetical protein